MGRLACVCTCLIASCAARVPTTAPRQVDEETDVAARLDAYVAPLLVHWGVPGATVAITYEGRLVIARGYGSPRLDPTERTPPSTRFRIASLTKPITSVAIHMLHARGALDLDARVVDLLDLETTHGVPSDARWRAITVRHLLEHSAGFDRMASFDPMFANARYAKMAGRPPRPDTLDDILRAMLAEPLDFAPGTDQAYSNFGYALLGLVIERVTGTTYDSFVRDAVLGPMGVRGAYVGAELPEHRPPDEAFYFPDRTDVFRPSLFDPAHGLVSPADGGFFMRPMAAHGGLVMSAVEYARFLVHVDGQPSPDDVLSSSSRDAMLAPPRVPDPIDDGGYYAHGWDVVPTAEGLIVSHTGAKPGTTTLAVCLPRRICYVALTNGRPLEGDFVEALDLAILDAITETPTFPPHDLFPSFDLPPPTAER